MISFLSTALNLSPNVFLQVPWWACIKAFNIVTTKNAPRIPLPLIVESDNKKLKEEGWNYKGRLWHMYSHLLAKSYGWTLEYVANLKIEEALAKVQEILTDEQLDREFIWASSEVAYPYDSRTQKSKFVPLTRPYWMRPIPILPKKTKILKSLMPVGAVDYGAVGKEYEPQEIKH